MNIDRYKTIPGFPFDNYFDNSDQYIHAQSYWLSVLRSAKGFDDREWVSKLSQVDVRDEMYVGRVCYIIALEKRKELMLNTASILGEANMLFRENQGISDEEYAAQKKMFGQEFELDREFLNGITYKEAFLQAQEDARKSPLTTWVEKATHWQSDMTYSERGYEVEVERLVLTSEISERAEPLAIQALELFLQNGPAMERVNSVFSPDPQA
ncbi:hypothetical protein ACUY1T_02570 [Billgrantia sp. Q4P2]|uniref:hypothetical protein n=1 Tax=Billgrantia sp. Q4P2 TaxID=3463857 RepID=UPI0040560FB2